MDDITIEFTPAAQAAIARFEQLPQRVLLGIARGIDESMQYTIATITRDFLSFPKDQPATLEGLRVQSGQLRKSVWASRAVISGDTVTATIGSPLKYAGIHEFGGTFKRVLVGGSVRLRTDARGNLLRQGRDGRLAVFAKKSHARARSVDYAGGKQFEVTYPARAPFRKGLHKSLPQIKETVSAAILREVQS